MTSTTLRWTLGLPLAGAALAAVAVAVAAPPSGQTVASAASPTEQSVTASPLAPPKYERDVARVIAERLQYGHYEERPLDDEVSQRWFDRYVDRLDYQRQIFLQSDIDRFRQQYRDTMDDAVQSRPADVTAAIDIYETYRTRLRERMASAKAILASDIDLTNDEAYVPDRHDSKLQWPASAEQATELWRQRIEDTLIVGLIEGESDAEIRERLTKRYDRYLKNLEDTESTDVMETWLGSLANAYDPHSGWLPPARNEDFDIDITNSVSGIGAQLQTKGDHTEVMEVIAGGPAFHSERLFAGDKILAVAQGDEDPVDVVGLRIDKVVRYIRGEVGTEVRLHVLHADGEREIIDMIREVVTIEKSAAQHKIHEVDGKKLGVIDLPRFYVDPNGLRHGGRRATSDVKRALKALQEEGADGLVLDLRGNGGGSLVEAIDVTGLFLTAGPIVQVRSRTGRIEAIHDRDPQAYWLKPMVILTDPFSASASEILAGALQDYGRAVVVGSERTHGKGTVQVVEPLTQRIPGRHREDVGGALKLTIQKFYRVSGGSTQAKGVESDIVLPSRFQGLDIYESDLDHALAWDRIPPAPHVRVSDLSGVLPELSKRSATRLESSEDFGTLQKVLEEREALEDQQEVSLVLSTRKTEHEAREARAGLDDTSHGEDEGDKDENDFVLDEALAVLDDLVELGSAPR
ncbi:MAG: carboxy terminal-processing peptidase [Myxococcales bacterium]|nr:carboxy terminal-processing peptidase [Myxococcales bacterium]